MTHVPRVYVDGREFVPKLAPAINKEQTLADYLKQLREEAGVSPADVRAMTGIHTWQLEAWEKETSTLRFSEAALLARVYGVSLDLFGARIMAIVDSARGEEATQPPFISHPSGTVQPVEDKVPQQIQAPAEEQTAAKEEAAPKAAEMWDPDLDDSDEFVEDAAPAQAERSDALEQAEEQAALEEDEAPPTVPEKVQTKKSNIANLLRDL